jgi:uncharacterized protein YcaQ
VSSHRAGTTTLSLPEARRLAIASQGFGPRLRKPSITQLRALAARVHAIQIDSVNVLVRAHYVPAFARLGPYPMSALDSLAYRTRELFEYWGHAACLMPVALYPLLRYRMQRHAGQTLEYMRSKRGAYMARVYAEVAERGPISAGGLADRGQRSGGWWGWWGSGNGKASLEHLYDAGLVAIAGRRNFERLYDIPERVIPQTVLDVPPPTPEASMKRLIVLAAQACGVGTLVDITGYFYVDGWRDRMPAGPLWELPRGVERRRTAPIAKRLVAELVEERQLLPVRVDGWKDQAYLHPAARVPRTVDARAIVTPFDSLVWERSRIERLFGMKYSIELYTPAPRRVFGYYVCPFLLGDTLVARCDLKADRERRVLMVQSAFLEPGREARRVAPDLAAELGDLQEWLELDRIEVGRRGDLALPLRRALTQQKLEAGS